MSLSRKISFPRNPSLSPPFFTHLCSCAIVRFEPILRHSGKLNTGLVPLFLGLAVIFFFRNILHIRKYPISPYLLDSFFRANFPRVFEYIGPPFIFGFCRVIQAVGICFVPPFSLLNCVVWGVA